MFNPKSAIFIRLLSILILPLLACAIMQAATPTPPAAPTRTRTITPLPPALAARRTSIVRTNVARRTAAVPTRTRRPTATFFVRSPTPTQPTPTTTPTFSVAALVPRINSVSILAPSLRNNLLLEDDRRTLLVYLPLSYYEAEKSYPVVYYLLDFGVFGVPEGIRPEDIEKDVVNGTAREMIIVIVSGLNALGGSFYVNSPVTGNWDDFVTRDVVSYIDDTYRTIPNAASRGIGGNAMGGFGALHLAMLHPDVFGAAYSISPTLFDETGLAESPMFATEDIINNFLNLQARELALPADEAVADMKFNAGDAQLSLAYGAAFAPKPQAGPPYIDYPYYRQNGRTFRDEAIWQRWEAGFGGIPDKVQAYRAHLSKLNGIAIDCGTQDRYRWVPRGCEYFSAQLTAADIQNQLVRFEGDDEGALERRIRAFMLPFFSQKLVFDN